MPPILEPAIEAAIVERFDFLLTLFAEEVISAEQLHEFNNLLRTQEVLCHRYLEMMAIQVHLRDAIGLGLAAAQEAGVGPARNGASQGPRGRKSGTRNGQRRRTRGEIIHYPFSGSHKEKLALTAMLTAVCLIGFLFFLNPPDDFYEGAENDMESVANHSPVEKRYTDYARIVACSGEVFFIDNDGHHRATVHQQLNPGSRMRTGANGSIRLQYADQTQVEIGNSSEIYMTTKVEDRMGKELYIHQGLVTASVMPQLIGHPFVLQSHDARAQVLGTQFTFMVDQNGSQLTVQQGQVSFQKNINPAVSLVLSGGEYALTGDAIFKVHTRHTANLVEQLAQVSADGLVLHLTFDGVDNSTEHTPWIFEADQSSAKNNLTLYDALRVPGRIGTGALSSNGVSTYGEIPRSTSLPTANNPFTMAVWARSAGIAEQVGKWNMHHFLCFGTNLSRQGVWLGSNGKTLGAGGMGDFSVLMIPDFWQGDNVWHHIALTYDGSEAILYVDGKERRRAAKEWNITPGILRVGSQVNNKEYWHGAIDDVRIYTRVLNAAELQHLLK